MAFVYLGLGTNLGEKERNLHDAVIALGSEVGNVLRLSSFHASRPWGFKSENNFLNAVMLIETNLSPFELLNITQDIEKNLGRIKKSDVNYTDRIIDIDILLYDNLIIDQPKLKIPHPLLTERDFVLIPLAEIAPDLIHPLLKKKIIELVNR